MERFTVELWARLGAGATWAVSATGEGAVAVVLLGVRLGNGDGKSERKRDGRASE
jgi:hypothetical protein